MAYLKLEELQNMIKNYLQQVLEDKTGDMVRMAYSAAVQPFQAIDRNVCYLTIQPADHNINRQIDTRYEDMDGCQAREINSYTRVIGVSLVFYGPDAYDNAILVRMELLSGSRDNLLAKNGLHIVPDVSEPLLTRELYQNHWIMRADLTVQFNNRVVNEKKTAVNYIQSASITVIGDADERTIKIEEGDRN